MNFSNFKSEIDYQIKVAKLPQFNFITSKKDLKKEKYQKYKKYIQFNFTNTKSSTIKRNLK